jgi:hypothetical protein
MPRYEFDPSQDNAVTLVLPKDDYEFVVGEPKSFQRKNAKNEDSFGVRYPLTVAEGQYQGKRIFYSTYYQSQGGRDMAKVFLMAVNGYPRNAEGEEGFNEEFKGADWAFNPEDTSVGEAFRSVVGKRVRGSLDIQPAKDREGNLTGEQNQQFQTWSPLQVAATA